MLAYRALRALQPADDEAGGRRAVVEAVRQTADRLGNTPAVARGSYVHPAVLEAYMDGSLGSALVEVAEEQTDPPQEADADEEAAVADLLRQRRRQAARGAGARRTVSRRRPRRG